jgi:lipopolysaccharide/colanic/teichoic acid biosynthesis glycosyltransferase
MVENKETIKNDVSPKKFDLLYIGIDVDFVKKLKDSFLFNVTHKKNGYLAVSYLESSPQPDAIVSEIIVEGINGFALFKEIQQNADWQMIPYILIDQSYTAEERERALKMRICDIYQKPLKPERLFNRIVFLKRFKIQSNMLSYLEMKKHDVATPLWKRAFDIVFASIVLILLSPLFLLIIILIRIESKGPIFYSGKRVGKGYNIFPFHKFRSMYVGADAKLKEYAQTHNQYAEGKDMVEEKPIYDCPRCKESPSGQCSTILKDAKGKDICEYQQNAWQKKKTMKFIKIKNDPRITKMGRFMRKTSIDELPQLFNVLKGEMSIVGNRPLPLYEAEYLTDDKYSDRFLVSAGITGWWQVSKRGGSKMTEEERQNLDNEYLKKMSFWFDLYIILKTPGALLSHEEV